MISAVYSGQFRPSLVKEEQRPLIPLIVDILFVVFILTELLMRRGGEAKSLESTPEDRASTRLIGISYAGAVALIVVTSVTNAGAFTNIVVGLVGVALMLLGLGLRFWSMGVLGRYYSRTLRVVDGQRVVREGPYRLVRHPGYLSSLCIWVGSALGFQNLILICTFSVGFAAVYVYRIRVEEKMLSNEFGIEYADYVAKSWKLIPFIY